MPKIGQIDVIMKNPANSQHNEVDSNQYCLEIDPDLQRDVEINLPHNIASAGTRRTLSGKSRNTAQSKQTEPNSEIVKSRGRPIKPHETEPFLCIDNLSPEKKFVSDKLVLKSNGKGTTDVMVILRHLKRSIWRMRRSFHIHLSDPSRPSSHRATAQPFSTTPSLGLHLQQMSSSFMSTFPQASPVPPSPSSASGNISTRQVTSIESREPELGEKPCFMPDNEVEPSATFGICVKHAMPHTAHEFFRSDSNIREAKSQLELRLKKNRHYSDKQVVRPNTGPQRENSNITSAHSRSGITSRAGSHKGFQMRVRSAGSRIGRVTPVNTPFQSPKKPLRSPNHHVKQPFKHSVNKPDMTPDDRQTSSMGLKERTSLAAFHIQNMLSVAGEKHAHKVVGRLQKGKLKPLYPVQIEGPSIEKCRGIVSETHSYQPSPSRTLQRQLHLMNTIPNVYEYLYGGRPTTGESLHRTSVASCSSLDEIVDNNKGVRAAPNDTDIYPEQTEPAVLEPVTPENTFVPIHNSKGLTDVTAMAEKMPRMFATEITRRDYDDMNKDEDDMQHKINIGGSGETNSCSPISSMLDSNEDSPDGRCHSGNPSKSVRFVEGTTKEQNEYNNEMKQLVNENILKPQKDSVCSLGSSEAGSKNITTDDGFNDLHKEIESVAKRNKQNIKSSCKDDILEHNCMKDNDDDSDQERNTDSNSKNRNANKSSVLSASKLESRNSKTDESNGKKSANNGNGQKRNEKLHVSRPLSAKSVRSRLKESQKSYVENKKSEVSNTSEMNLLDAVNQSGHKNSGQSENGHCSQSHTNTLRVSLVLHGDRVAVGFGPESPTKSRSSSPKRCYQSGTDQVLSTDRMLPSSEQDCDDIKNSRHFEQRSKVKFILDGNDSEMKTIFMEDDEDLDIMSNQDITFDKLDSEIAMVCSVIQKSLLQETNEDKHDQKCSEDLLIADNSLLEDQSYDEKMQERSDERTDHLDGMQDRSGERTDGLDSVRESYYKLIEVYRKHCMERSEAYGVLSMSLVTSRQTNDMVSTRLQSQRLVHQKSTQDILSKVTQHDKKQKELAGNSVIDARLTSDSGHGSVDKLSDLSRSASQAVLDVPKLDLGSSISHLGIECNETTVTPDFKDGSSIVSTARDRNLLEICCEQLSAMEKFQMQKGQSDVSRKNREKDLSSLQVVASTKSLCKNRVDKPPSEIKATFPPLCFTINARPPKGYLYYFAYGPDMNPDRFACYIQHGPLERHWGLLFGFSLVFNKRGVSEEAGGFANLEYNVLRSVEGCIYKIKADELHVLDKAVGYPEHYEHLVLPVCMCNSSNPDDLGIAQYCVPALTYIAQNKWTENERQLSCDYSLSQCVRSADIVTPNYKDFLVSVAKKPVSVLA